MYALADYMGATELMRFLVSTVDRGWDHSCDLGNRLPTPETLALMWELLPDGDEMKQLLLTRTTKFMTLPALNYGENLLPKDFRFAVLRRIFELEIELP